MLIYANSCNRCYIRVVVYIYAGIPIFKFNNQNNRCNSYYITVNWVRVTLRNSVLLNLYIKNI